MKNGMRALREEVQDIRREVLRLTPPEYFSMRDVARAFFGALVITSTFIFSSRLAEQTLLLTPTHLFFIVLATLVLLTVEIYFIGYARIVNRRSRPFYEFWAKRIVTFYGVALLVSFSFAWLFAYDRVFPTFGGMMMFSVVASMPASIGAAMSDLLRRY